MTYISNETLLDKEVNQIIDILLAGTLGERDLVTRVTGGRDLVPILARRNDTDTSEALDVIGVLNDAAVFSDGGGDLERVGCNATSARLQILFSADAVVTTTLGSTGDTAKGFTSSTSGGTLLLVGCLGRATVGEVTADAITDGVRGRADTLGRVVRVIRDEAVLAVETTRGLDVTDGVAVVRISALLVAGLGVDLIESVN